MSKSEAPATYKEAMELAMAHGGNSKSAIETAMRTIALANMKGERANMKAFFLSQYRNENLSAMEIMQWTYECELYPIASTMFEAQEGGVVHWTFAKQQEMVIRRTYSDMVKASDLSQVEFVAETDAHTAEVYYTNRFTSEVNVRDFEDMYLNEETLLAEAARLTSAARKVRSFRERGDKEFYKFTTDYIEKRNFEEALEEGIHGALAGENGWL